MRVRLAHTLYWGGPSHGRIIFDPWPFDAIPREGETVFVGDDETDGSQGFSIERAYWDVNTGEIELRTIGENGESDEDARSRMRRLRELGFDYGPPHPFEAAAPLTSRGTA